MTKAWSIYSALEDVFVLQVYIHPLSYQLSTCFTVGITAECLILAGVFSPPITFQVVQKVMLFLIGKPQSV